MHTCVKCKKLYAERFASCPHCESSPKWVGGAVALLLGGAIIWAIGSGNNTSTKDLPVSWESISGTQQGVFLRMDIDANSIERTSDGASASVILKLPPTNEPQRITYICRAPETGLPGAVLFNDKVTDLVAGSTGDAVMRRICFGPVRGSSSPAKSIDSAQSNRVAPGVRQSDNTSAATGSEALSTLIPSCVQGGGIDCTNDIYRKVWRRLEAENGLVTKVNTASIQHFNTGAAEVLVYTYVPDTRYDPSKLRRLFFDCAGQFRDQTEGFSPSMDAPPRSIAGRISAIACEGARDTRLEDADRNTGAGTTPSEYCNDFSPEACGRIIAFIKSRTNPPYCKPGFAALGSTENEGLSPEQIRICFLMAGDFAALSTR